MGSGSASRGTREATCLATETMSEITALAVAALGADGYTYLGKTEYIERGYENLLADLKTLGAAIERID